MIFIAVLFGLLGLLLQWLLNKKASGKALTKKEINNIERVLGKVEKIKAIAVPMGCRPEGVDEEMHAVGSAPATEDIPPPIVVAFMEAMSAEDADWSPGGIISDRLYEFVVNNYMLPYMRKKWPDLPGTDESWRPWLLAQIKESQS